MESFMKLAILISCTDHYNNRMYLFDEYLTAQGYTTQYIAADFHHIEKKHFSCAVPGAKQISVRPYAKNLSLSRILSHRDFARGVYRYLENLAQEPALIVAEIPPNYLASYMARYKRKHPQVKLVMDLFDLWPETFPSGAVKKLFAPVFALWGSLRNRSLPYADLVITECNLYRHKLKLPESPKFQTVYLAADSFDAPISTVALPTDELHLCYLGSVNNIIDIPTIALLVQELAAIKPVTVHVIGRGERHEEFLEALRNAGARAVNHGAIFDAQKKHEILTNCHFGLNIMKRSVCIGLTMKSVDYWSHGLPIINNVSADTAELVQQEGLGINLSESAARTIAALSEQELCALRCNVRHTFTARFSHQVILNRLAAVFSSII